MDTLQPNTKRSDIVCTRANTWVRHYNCRATGWARGRFVNRPYCFNTRITFVSPPAIALTIYIPGAAMFMSI